MLQGLGIVLASLLAADETSSSYASEQSRENRTMLGDAEAFERSSEVAAGGTPRSSGMT